MIIALLIIFYEQDGTVYFFRIVGNNLGLQSLMKTAYFKLSIIIFRLSITTFITLEAWRLIQFLAIAHVLNIKELVDVFRGLQKVEQLPLFCSFHDQLIITKSAIKQNYEQSTFILLSFWADYRMLSLTTEFRVRYMQVYIDNTTISNALLSVPNKVYWWS